MSTACVIVIGNEILSGRTRDENLTWLAVELNKAGLRLRESRIVPDITEAIVKAINECRAEYDYVFTTGGIGPTHDDITAEAIAKAFRIKYVLNKEAEAILIKNYAGKMNDARRKMAYMPEGATLIANPVSAAPGFIIENVYVMAGVPGIMRAMFDGIRGSLKGGKPVLSATVSTFLTESMIAAGLTKIQNDFADVEIGSYPFIRLGRLGTSLVARHTDTARLEQVKSEITRLVQGLNGEIAPD